MQNGSCRQPKRTKEIIRLFLNLAFILVHAKNPMTWPNGSFVPTFDWTSLATSPMNAIDGGKTHPLLESRRWWVMSRVSPICRIWLC